MALTAKSAPVNLSKSFASGGLKLNSSGGGSTGLTSGGSSFTMPKLGTANLNTKSLSSPGLKYTSSPTGLVGSNGQPVNAPKIGGGTPLNVNKALSSGGLKITSAGSIPTGLIDQNGNPVTPPKMGTKPLNASGSLSASAGSSGALASPTGTSYAQGTQVGTNFYKNLGKTDSAFPSTAPANLTPMGQTATDANGNPMVNTSTPSPGNVNATPYTKPQVSPAQAGFDNAIASGQKAPQDGSAGANTSPFIPPADNSGDYNAQIQQTVESDPGYQKLLQDQNEYNSVANQQGSLLDQYKQMETQAGIPQINMQLLNMQNVINGTEDDIRNEVQAANGFATNSQVLGLASSRNKVLIQNYNNLLDTKKMAEDQITTMMGLAQQDQAAALAHISEKMGFDQKMIDYRDKFTNHATEGFKNIMSAVGADGLYNSLVNTDPTGRSLAQAEQLLGFQPGQLKQVAGMEAAKSAQTAKMQALDLQIKQADLGLKGQDMALKRADLNAKNVGLTPGPSLPYNSAYSSPTDYVNKVLTQQGVSYDKAAAATPKGTVSAIDNKTGQTVFIDAKDWDASSGSIRPSYTVIYNNLK